MGYSPSLLVKVNGNPGQDLHDLVIVPAAVPCTALGEARPYCPAKGHIKPQSSTGPGNLSGSWQQTQCISLFSASFLTGWYVVSTLQGQLHGCVSPLCQLIVWCLSSWCGVYKQQGQPFQPSVAASSWICKDKLEEKLNLANMTVCVAGKEN